MFQITLEPAEMFHFVIEMYCYIVWRLSNLAADTHADFCFAKIF